MFRRPKQNLVCSFLLVCAAAAARAEVLQVSNLSEQERIHVEYSSRGCFDGEKKEYEIVGGRAVRFAEAASPTHTISLSTNEVSGLDALFGFYRLHLPGGCTTTDDIQISYYRGRT